jgi:hypothetical protein
MFCFKKLTAFGYADITLTLDNSILSDDRSILRLSFARFTRRYWEHHSYFLVLPLVICLNSGGSLASREIIGVICVVFGNRNRSIWSHCEKDRLLLLHKETNKQWSNNLAHHRKLFNPQLTLSLTVIKSKNIRVQEHQSYSYAGKHRIDLIVVHKQSLSSTNPSTRHADQEIWTNATWSINLNDI